MRLASLLLLVATVTAQPSGLPPPFPRPGTTLLLENDAVAVWNVSWLKQQYPLHTHRYDRSAMPWTPKAIASSRKGMHREGWSPPRRGCFRPTAPMSRTWRRAPAIPPMRAVLIVVKTAAPRPPVAPPPDGLHQVAGAPVWENDRAAAWAVMPGSAAPVHRHAGDAVELTFDGSTTPKAAFLVAGTTHTGPAPGEGGRAYIFEIK